VRIDVSGEIRSDYMGFARLIRLAEKTRERVFDDIDINMRNITWLDANMCASFEDAF